MEFVAALAIFSAGTIFGLLIMAMFKAGKTEAWAQETKTVQTQARGQRWLTRSRSP